MSDMQGEVMQTLLPSPRTLGMHIQSGRVDAGGSRVPVPARRSSPDTLEDQNVGDLVETIRALTLELQDLRLSPAHSSLPRHDARGSTQLPDLAEQDADPSSAAASPVVAQSSSSAQAQLPESPPVLPLPLPLAPPAPPTPQIPVLAEQAIPVPFLPLAPHPAPPVLVIDPPGAPLPVLPLPLLPPMPPLPDPDPLLRSLFGLPHLRFGADAD